MARYVIVRNTNDGIRATNIKSSSSQDRGQQDADQRSVYHQGVEPVMVCCETGSLGGEELDRWSSLPSSL